jgi:hypothetical protein
MKSDPLRFPSSDKYFLLLEAKKFLRHLVGVTWSISILGKLVNRNFQRRRVKLPAHRAGLPGHASGEQYVSKGSFAHIVPLDPAYKAGLAGHFPVKDIRQRDDS